MGIAPIPLGITLNPSGIEAIPEGFRVIPVQTGSRANQITIIIT